MSAQPPEPSEPFEFAVDEPTSAKIDSRKNSYSMLLLFYLTTMAAILAAFCRLAFVGTDWPTHILVNGYAICGIASIVMSMLLGYFIGRTWWSTLLGLLAGALCGVVVLLMVLVQPSHYESAGMMLCAGCWFLAIITIAGPKFFIRAE